MIHFALLLAALSIMLTPTYCAAAGQTPGQRTSSMSAHSHHKPVRRLRPTVAVVKNQELVQPVALTGQLIYEELGLPPPPSLEELRIQSEEHGDTERVVEEPKLQPLEAKYDPAAETLSPSGMGWNAWLKMLACDLIPGKSSNRSWVSDISAGQSLQLADQIASYLATQAPAQSTTILLAPPWAAQANSAFTVALNDALRKIGFGVIDSKRQAPNAQVVRYQICALNGGVLVQLDFNQKQTNQYYGLGSSNALVAGAPLCVREVH